MTLPDKLLLDPIDKYEHFGKFNTCIKMKFFIFNRQISMEIDCSYNFDSYYHSSCCFTHPGISYLLKNYAYLME